MTLMDSFALRGKEQLRIKLPIHVGYVYQLLEFAS